MTKVYPRLERRKLKRIQEGKRPFKTLSERMIYNQIIRHGMRDAMYSTESGIMLRKTADTGKILESHTGYYDQLYQQNTETVCAILSPDNLKHMLVCLKADGVEVGKQKIVDAVNATGTFVYENFDSALKALAKSKEKQPAKLGLKS